MSDFLADLYSAWGDVLCAVWPEVAPDPDGTPHLYEAEHVNSLPWKDLALPFAVVHIADVPRDAEWGANSEVYAPVVDLYYVGEVTGAMGPVRGKLMELRQWLRDHSGSELSSGQLLRTDGMTWSDQIEANQVLAEKGATHRAGYLRAVCLVGEAMG